MELDHVPLHHGLEVGEAGEGNGDGPSLSPAKHDNHQLVFAFLRRERPLPSPTRLRAML
jgi:hypothetical protein